MTVCRHALCVLLPLALACSGGTPRRGGSPPGDGGPDTSPRPADGGRPDAPAPPECAPTGPGDDDGDGFTEADGDCNDCSPQVNPGAFDFPGNGYDEDCDGGDAADFPRCDDGLAMASDDPLDGARAIGLCRTTTEDGPGWGVISARYVTADGASPIPDPLMHGLLPSFGAATPPEGAAMLALSSGIARGPGQPDYTADCDRFDGISDPPPGFPKESPACPGVITGELYDPASLEVRLRVPTNARGFSFRSIFYTYEYPLFICDEYNDFFVTLMDPRPAGLPDGNIVFDGDGNLVSVNSSLFQVCDPRSVAGRDFTCPQGRDLLAGTGFDMTGGCPNPEAEVGGATGWLRTVAPVAGGEIVTLRFAIWDSGDGNLDSLVLVDGFEWSVEPPELVETVPDLI